ncbi:MAG: hypothetical protein HQM11_01815 [SAR324 cluster bacterium]|nr:hypothetical protein [SAR324 cluster bacterium]
MKQQFGSLILLDRIINEKETFHLSLMEKDDKILEPFLQTMEKEGLIEIGANGNYVVTEKGKETYQRLIQQQLSYTTHFDIYSHVDLGEGCFADKETDFLDDNRWTDLRVAVAEFKGIDPYRMVFLAMLSDESFFENPEWKFDLAMGTLFEEMESIVHNQVSLEELGYEDDDGSVSGNEVLTDIIEQGAALNQQRQEEQRQQEQEAERLNQTSPDDEIITTTTYYQGGYGYPMYDPWATMGAYAASALFVEALWYDPYW